MLRKRERLIVVHTVVDFSVEKNWGGMGRAHSHNNEHYFIQYSHRYLLTALFKSKYANGCLFGVSLIADRVDTSQS